MSALLLEYGLNPAAPTILLSLTSFVWPAQGLDSDLQPT